MIDLKKAVEAQLVETRCAVRQFPWEDRGSYANWLAQTALMVSHSTRLTTLAAAHCPASQTRLHHRLIDHSREERGHELLAASDLEELGLKVEDFPRLPSAAALVQIQYYWIQHRGAISLYGYILSLECMSRELGPEVLGRVSSAHGDRASRFIQLHAKDDIEHVDRAFKQLDAIPERERSLVVENLELSAALYRRLLEEIPVRAATPGLKAAA